MMRIVLYIIMIHIVCAGINLLVLLYDIKCFSSEPPVSDNMVTQTDIQKYPKQIINTNEQFRSIGEV